VSDVYGDRSAMGCTVMAKKMHDSSSTDQLITESELISLLSVRLGIPLLPKAVQLDGCEIRLDGYYEDENRVVVVEAYSRVNELKSGQKRKIMSDILKLAFLQATFDPTPSKKLEKYLLFANRNSATFLEGKSWAATARRGFGIEIHVIDLSDESVDRLKAARRRQQKGMAAQSDDQ